MASSANLTTHVSQRSLETSDQEIGEIAPPSVLKVHGYICAKLRERRAGYATAEYAIGTVTIFEEFACLQFSVTDTRPRKMADLEAIESKVQTDDASNKTPVIFHSNFPPSILRKEVSTVTVNIDCRTIPNHSPAVLAIGKFCRNAFSNMKPELSAVNLNWGQGFRIYRVDHILSPGEHSECICQEK